MYFRSILADEKRRLDSRISELEEELDEERAQNEMLEEKAKRAQLAVSIIHIVNTVHGFETVKLSKVLALVAKSIFPSKLLNFS